MARMAPEEHFDPSLAIPLRVVVTSFLLPIFVDIVPTSGIGKRASREEIFRRQGRQLTHQLDWMCYLLKPPSRNVRTGRRIEDASSARVGVDPCGSRARGGTAGTIVKPPFARQLQRPFCFDVGFSYRFAILAVKNDAGWIAAFG